MDFLDHSCPHRGSAITMGGDFETLTRMVEEVRKLLGKSGARVS